MPLEKDLVAGQRWEFDEEVAAEFDVMLGRSIPRYDEMRETVTALATSFARSHTAIVDLGCSRGEALARVREHLSVGAGAYRYVGAEVSPPMVEAARERFGGANDVTILTLDLREQYPIGEGYKSIGTTGEWDAPRFASVTLAILTLQFVPIDYRQRILRRAWETTVPGGALLVVEKVLAADALIDDVMRAHYYNFKRENGYDPEEILRKRLALEGVLVPITARMNEELLRGAGFDAVDCFWAWMNFRGWVAVKLR